MNTENIYNQFLSLSETYSLYCRIGDTLQSDIDLNNAYFDAGFMRKTLILLLNIGFVSFEDNRYAKATIFDDEGAFQKAFIKKLESECLDEIGTALDVTKHYDEGKESFFFYRNSVKLDYSGLIMLLEQLGKLKSEGTRLYIQEKQFAKKYNKRSDQKKLLTVEELDGKLIMQRELGAEAEAIALDYEKELLLSHNITKTPQIISDIDVTAGYDIVSFLSNESEKADKFIEVKNCDSSFSFYFSRNELETARKKGDSYYLYLYNREAKNFRIVHNPYNVIFAHSQGNNWATIPQLFKVHPI